MTDKKMYTMKDVTQRSIDLNNIHFDSLEVVNNISKREQSVLTAAAIKYSKMKGIKDATEYVSEIESLQGKLKQRDARILELEAILEARGA